MSMEKFVNDFDKEFDCMSDGEKLYADALAHLIDKDAKDYIEALGDDAHGAMNIAAESDSGYC